MPNGHGVLTTLCRQVYTQYVNNTNTNMPTNKYK